MFVVEGDVFGYLTVLESGTKARTKVFCRCSCGTVKQSIIASLIYESTKSCGKCNAIKHGKSKTKIHNAWYNMMHRCYNASNKHYYNYGGRGIYVCERWHDFNNFYEDLGDVPEGLTLDRINNNDGYNIENVRWATMKQQRQNQRKSKEVQLARNI